MEVKQEVRVKPSTKRPPLILPPSLPRAREKPERSEMAKERGRRRHFKFCRVHSPHTNPHRYRDRYPRRWEPTRLFERGR